MDTQLEKQAQDNGVATSYDDQRDRRVEVAAGSVRAILHALGADEEKPAATSPLPPVVVLRQSEIRELAGIAMGPAVLDLEDGTSAPIQAVGDALTLGPQLPLGWHSLRVGDTRIPVCVAPDQLPRGNRAWGWMVQLYALRSRDSWGVGDLRDLRTLVEWTATHGGGLILVNPLHAVTPGTPVQPSPYYPASRRWTNPLYLHVEDTKEYAAASAALRASVHGCRFTDLGDRIDRDSAYDAKLSALELLFPGGAAVDDDIDDELRRFATWCALTEVHGRDWREWPQPLQHPDSPAVADAARDLTERVAFHAWLQICCTRQLQTVHAAARDAGMPVGVVHDLAVGADPAGADAWMLQGALALEAHIGAPPDPFNQQGQDWGMPPWHPRRLADLAYAPVREMVGSLLHHAGGVRIDHVLGVFRTWWVPVDGSARDGTFVAYDAAALLGVIALEVLRAGAVVVGEDLGTTPSYVPRTLADRGVLGTSVLWFERDKGVGGEAGPLRPLPSWREAAMASVTTHDLPTALGWLRGEHVRVRAELGLLDDPAAERETWEAERAELLDVLAAAGLIEAEADEDELVHALHMAVASTPSRYVLASLGDAVGDIRAPNLPGTTDQYPNWKLPVADADGRPWLLEDLLADERVRRLAADLTGRVG